MKFYCGIALSARDCHVCVIDLRQNVRKRVEEDQSYSILIKAI